ncbi:hypothetical protein SUGI_0815640 [Cryptomeria japonica]|nr:hypothetical protein SUGI_0815640 [Cryptomeria japonica]
MKTRLLCRRFSSTPWISPLQFKLGSKGASKSQNLEPRRAENDAQLSRKCRFVRHVDVINSIFAEPDLQRSLNIFNNAAKQPRFYHNHETYSVIINKLGREKKIQSGRKTSSTNVNPRL